MKPIKIMPIGLSGSGKSVYLASLYEKLATKSRLHCYHLETTIELSRMLANTYGTIASQGKGWPPATMGADYRDYDFDCIVETKHQKFCIMKLKYLDFPGGALNGETEHNEEFDQRLETSDAFLILLDGVKIYRALRGDEQASNELEYDIRMLASQIYKHLKKPIHFLVTKWDVLNGSFELPKAIELLRRYTPFTDLVEKRSTLGRATRIIPVSAVGYNFATMDSNGLMVKSKNGKATPIYVDIPISFLLFDLIQEAKKNIEIEKKNNLSARIAYAVFGSGKNISLIASKIIDFLPIPESASFVKNALKSGVEVVADWAQERREKMIENYGAALLDVKSVKEATLIIEQFHEMERYYLLRTFPESELSKYS